MSSDIQVFVRWKEQTIFAGEDVECAITFKNVAPDEPDRPKHLRGGSRPVNGVKDGTNYSPAKSFNPFAINSNRRPTSAGHRSRQAFGKSHRHSASTSLASPLSMSHSFPPATSVGSNGNGPSPGHRHKRSVSILSVDPDATPELKQGAAFSPKPHRSHGRSASLQVAPRRNEVYGNNALPSSRSPGHPPSDPPSHISSPDLQRSQTRSSSTISSPVRPNARRRPSPLPPDFKFPQAPPPPNESVENISPGTSSRPVAPADKSTIPAATSASPGTKTNGATPDRPTHLAPATKILSNSTIDGSRRSSMEFCSMSNNSTETVESEYIPYSANRARNPVRHRRHFSSLEPIGQHRSDHSQSLLMGYAQINASFTVDGSLVNHSLFEEVKRKGVVGTPGGSDGVTKSEKSRGGFWDNLGLGGIGDSIGGLLSAGELDGLRDMRGAQSSQSIPLLSTPQSLLFVDLRLSPGEEKTFSFSFTLPKGLPASHKGKAIKISYNLVIGTQRANSPRDGQRVHRINVPFRVLSGVDEQGQVLGHDIMRPYVLLRDEARVQKLGPKSPLPTKAKSVSGKIWSSPHDFLSYVDEILDQQGNRESDQAMGTPVETHSGPGLTSENFSCKDAIDLAILRSNQTMASDRSANRFEISRNGRRIAVVVLNRPAHRLGETVVATVDFSDAVLPCYVLRGSLETSEKVNPAIALRSSASISRATRRVHATCFENTLFATKVVFTPAIPVSATPSLITSGVSLDWELRFEFVTCGLRDEEDARAASGANLLEPIERDDRGTVFTSLENVSCQSFEIGIPLTVYGGTVQEPGPEELRGIPI